MASSFAFSFSLLPPSITPSSSSSWRRQLICAPWLTGSNSWCISAISKERSSSYVRVDAAATWEKRKAVCPWLMLPPSFDGTDMVYDFYSLGKDEVMSLKKRDDGDAESELPDDECEFVGSSHGWIACHKRHYGDIVFLSNPLSNTHIKLPPLTPLTNWLCGPIVHNVVISSPDPENDENCRAVMIYDSTRELAFCCPSSSSNWTPFGTDDYVSVVYSSRQKLFFCVTEEDGIEAWDLNNLESPPVMIPMKDVCLDSEELDYPVALLSKDHTDLDNFHFDVSTSLAVADKSDALYQVRRFTAYELCPDGSHAQLMEFGDLDVDPVFPYKTTHFDVYKYDTALRHWKYMDAGCLDGMALFIGKNHGFALSAADYPALKPDAIYFTDIQDDPDYFDIGGGHDIGIFNYGNNTISPCYYPCDYPTINKILPPPFWFTPDPKCLFFRSLSFN